MKQSINKVIFPFISALILAACGGSAPEEPVAPAPEPAAPQVVTPAPKTVQKPKAPVKKTRSRTPSLPSRQPQTLAPRRKGRANDRPGPRVAIIKNCRKGGA